jgi:hypothetical protein
VEDFQRVVQLLCKITNAYGKLKFAKIGLFRAFSDRFFGKVKGKFQTVLNKV